MNPERLTQDALLRHTGAAEAVEVETLQELWSGYGTIRRYRLVGSDLAKTVVVKHVRPPRRSGHPRGWDGARGHARKLRSYAAEARWYEDYGRRSAARLPRCFGVERGGDDEVLILLEDLDAAGFHLRKTRVAWPDVAACLRWLARFHASYLGVAPEGLWPVGTYWHLDTRPDELAALDDERLRAAAPAIDARLNACTHQTLVHGDAKLANFCFTAADGARADEPVAAVDFQYVGGGCGMKDVAYFVGSCLDEDACERLEGRILDTYFATLHEALDATHPPTFDKLRVGLEAEWRALYPVAWADFHRFLKGWSPGHWKLTSYSERVTAAVIDQL